MRHAIVVLFFSLLSGCNIDISFGKLGEECGPNNVLPEEEHTACFGDGEPYDVSFPDLDGDGYGNPEHAWCQATACDRPEGYVINNEDCDDADAAINPDAEEVCDGIDNNCDYYHDEDADGNDVCPERHPRG